MDFNAVMQIIGQWGFPIACAIALAYFSNKIINDNRNDMKATIDTNREDAKAREAKYQEQIASFSVSLDRFNDTLNKIDNRLAVVEEAVKK